jgi:iron(III) transport system substrate-binding protein
LFQDLERFETARKTSITAAAAFRRVLSMSIIGKFIQRSVFTLVFVLLASSASAQSASMDELYKRALQEGGTLNFYGTLAQINAEKILPVFEKRFPGIKINHVDATSDKMVARAIAEARGGRTLGDVLQVNLDDTVQAYEQKLLAELPIPEAQEYPDGMKGSFWLPSDMDIFIAGWNTNLVKKEEEPKQFDDFADPKWKNRLVAEPTDLELLIGLAKYKFKSDEKAIALMKKIAANNPEFHKGHSRLAELLSAGQAAACFTCYSQHFPPRIQKGRR